MIPKVSICIPAYNFPQGLRRALESIKSQEFRDFEVIVSDDSTNNDSLKVVEEFQGEFALHYRKNPHPLGTPGNWNQSISDSSGKYVKILHHDDWFTDPKALGKFVDLLEMFPEVSFGFSACYQFNVKTKEMRIHRPTGGQISRFRKDASLPFFGNFIGAPSTTIFRRWNGLFFDSKIKWVVDIDFYMRVLKNSQFSFCPEPLVCVSGGGPHQVTNSCAFNSEVEIPEFIYLYNKLGQFNFRYVKFFYRLLLFYQIKSIGEFPKEGFKDLPMVVIIPLIFLSARYCYRSLKNSFKYVP